MASIQTKGNKKYLVYDDPNANGKRKQIWSEIAAGQDPQVVLAEFNLKKLKGKIIVPSTDTLEMFIARWIEVYAPENWGYSMYQSSMGLIQNHIIEEIGFMRMKDIKPIDIELLIGRLRKKKQRGAKSYNKQKSEIPCLSSTTVREVYNLLFKIFDKAVEWKCIEENPVICKRPEKAKTKRSAWSGRVVLSALKKMEDNDFLHLAVHTAFSCSLRNGETMGITLDCINLDQNYIIINKTIQRVSLTALDLFPRDKLIYVFPQKVDGKKSALVLKQPKTESSSRIVYMTSQLRAEIIRRLEQIKQNKAYYGDSYAKYDYEMLFSLPDGSPIEPKLCEKRFNQWQQDSELGEIKIDFHGIRHSSVAYKLKLSGGDLTTVKGDSGHSTIQMVGSYADHLFDEDRMELTGRMESDFYADEDDISWFEKKYNLLIDQLTFLIEKEPSLRQRVQSALLALDA